MKHYPFKFRTEEALTPASYGKQVKNYKVPSKIKNHPYQVELASLYNKDIEFSLFIVPEGKPGNDYRVGYEVVMPMKAGTYTPLTSKKENILILPVSNTPNELMVNLSKEMRHFDEMYAYQHHILERVAILHPFEGKALKEQVQNHVMNEIGEAIERFTDDIAYDVTLDTYKQEIEFIIHAESAVFDDDESVNEFREHMKSFHSQMVMDIAQMTFNHRRKKGLEELPTDYKVDWHIDQKFFNQMALHYTIPYKNKEVFEVTSRGISIGVEVSTVSHEYKFSLYAKEMGLKKKRLCLLDKMQGHFEEMLSVVKAVFEREFFDKLHSLTIISMQTRERSDMLSDWLENHYARIQDELADALAFGLYAEKGRAINLAERHYLWFLSTEQELAHNEEMQDAIRSLMKVS